eukprot:756798-Hanusia_phi.AAC.2
MKEEYKSWRGGEEEEEKEEEEEEEEFSLDYSSVWIKHLTTSQSFSLLLPPPPPSLPPRSYIPTSLHVHDAEASVVLADRDDPIAADT